MQECFVCVAVAKVIVVGDAAGRPFTPVLVEYCFVDGCFGQLMLNAGAIIDVT